jgi:alkyl sulfatase BDS1-like metallo-beta-lactamase superfamily hydrolase
VKLNFDFGQGGNYFVELEKGVLNGEHEGGQCGCDRDVVQGDADNIILQQTKLDDAVSSGAVKISGDRAKLRDVVSHLDTFEFWFNIVTP